MLQVWAFATLHARGLTGLDTFGTSPLVQETHFGYLQIHADGVLTTAWHSHPNNRGTAWMYWHIVPRQHVAILTDAAYARTVPPHSPTIARIPTNAWQMIQLTVRWLHRVHAHTPLVKWFDAHRTARVQQTPHTMHARVMGIVFSAPTMHAPDFELRMHTCRHSHEHEFVVVRRSRARDQVSVQQYTYTSQSNYCTSATMSTSTARSMAACPASLSANARWAIQQVLTMHAEVDAMRERAAMPIRIDPRITLLTRQRRADLLAREQSWYTRSNMTWPF